MPRNYGRVKFGKAREREGWKALPEQYCKLPSNKVFYSPPSSTGVSEGLWILNYNCLVF